MLERRAGAAAVAVRRAAIVRAGPSAVRHLFRVTSGFESPVIGEIDIHGQVRTAFRRAQAAGLTGSLLGRLFPAALHASMQVRARTGLDVHGRSLARKAVDVGLRSFSATGRCDPRILLVGTGQMASTALEHLSSLGRPCRVAARDETYASRLVGRELASPLASLVEEIRRADLLICATSAAQPLVTVSHVREAMEGRARPLTVVDLAVPRNVDAAVADIDRVRLIDLSGLHDDASEGVVLRACLALGEKVIAAEAERFLGDVAAQDAGPIIAALRRQVLDICTERLSGLGTNPSHEQLVLAAHRIAGKLLHAPIIAMREAAAAGDMTTLMLLCEVFGLPPGSRPDGGDGGQACSCEDDGVTDERSRGLFARAQAVTPGGVNSPVRAFGAVGGTPRFMVRGEGPYLYDADGNAYVDLVCSWGPTILGHAHPAVVEARAARRGQGLSLRHARHRERSSSPRRSCRGSRRSSRCGWSTPAPRRR